MTRSAIEIAGALCLLAGLVLILPIGVVLALVGAALILIANMPSEG